MALYPDQRFQLWIGLDENRHTKDEMERTLGNIGKLILRVDGQDLQFQL